MPRRGGYFMAALMWTALLPLCETGQAAEVEKTLLLHSLETTEGLSPTWGQNCGEKRIEVNNDPKFVTEGKGSVRLVARSDKEKRNHYAGIMIPLKDADADARAIRFDCWTTTPAATQAVYLRLYTKDRQMAASWTNWRTPFQTTPSLQIRLVQGVSRGGFNWEKEKVQTEGARNIAAAEIIIGTADPDTVFDIYVDNVRMTETRHVPFAKIDKPKKLHIETSLVRGGKAEAVIIAPGAAEYAPLARKIQGRLKELSGAELPILTPQAVTPAQLAATNAIMIGNVCNNKAMTQIYAWLYTPVDDAYPPGDGYVAHTAHDPWGTGKNAVVIGASSPAGTARATEAFLNGLKAGQDILLPKLTLFELNEREMGEVERRKKELTDEDIRKQVEAAKRLFATGAHHSVASRMGNYGLRYARSGNDRLAALYREIAFAWHESYQAKPDIYGGPWGMDMDFHLMEILPAWDLLEESPALSEEDRLRVTKILHEFITTDVVRKASGALNSRIIRHNHTTFPALGLYFAGNYFKKAYNCPEADYWLDIARACFTLQMQAAKPWEDSNGYGWLVPYHTMRYALATLDPACFDNGNVRLQADYAILTMDNLGYQVPYGDTGSYQCWWSEVPFLRGAVFYHRDGRYAWALEKKAAVRKDSSMHQYACRLEASEPKDLLGLRAIPLDRMYWEAFKGPNALPLEKAVDKIVMRSTFDPQGQYLLLDGLSNGGHMHYDGNSISRITDRGRIWLADNDYIKSLPKYHNSILVFKDGQSETIPPWCELEAAAEGKRFGATQTAVFDYTGVDWYRTILWNKEKWFLVLDEMEAQEPAEYDFHCMWHTVGESRLTDEGIEVEQQGPRFFIKSPRGAHMKLTDDFELGKNWSGYAYAKPVVHSLRQVKTAKLAPGQRAGFANLLYGSDDQAPQEFSIEQADERSVIIRTKDETVLAGTGSPEKPREVAAGVRIAAKAFALSGGNGFAADARLISDRAFALSSSQPALAEISGDNMTITPAGETTITFSCGQEKPAFSGSVKNIRIEQGTWTAECGAGQTHISVKGLTAFADLPKTLKGEQKAAAPPTPAIQDGHKTGKVLWKYRPAIEEVLLSANAGRAEAYATGATPSCSPAPLARNIFAPDDPRKGNVIDNVLDGDEKSSEGSVMWEKDTPAAVSVDLKERYRITRIALKAWYGSKSSKGRSFMLHRASLEASDDNFQKGARVIGEIADNEEREDWGKPVTYAFDKADVAARHVRVSMTPRKGSGIYVAEVEVWGRPENGSIEAARLAAREDAFEKFTAISASDLDGDGIAEIVAGTSKNNVWLLGADGEARWKFPTGGLVTTTASADLDKSKQRYAIAGSEDCKVYALTAAGRLKWAFELPQYKSPGRVRVLFAADINGDGHDEVIAGGDNWRYYCMDREGKELWHHESVHPSSAGTAADLDGDGTMETLCGTVYYWWPCAGADGVKRWAYSVKSPHATAALTANLEGAKQRAAIFGSKDGTLHALDHAGKLLWTYNVGDEVTGALALDVNGDGRDEIIASSASYSVFALDGSGKRLWRRNLGDSVLCLAAADADGDGRQDVVAGCEDGTLFLLNGAGEIQGRVGLGSAVKALAPARVKPGPRQAVAAQSLEGFVTLVEW